MRFEILELLVALPPQLLLREWAQVRRVAARHLRAETSLAGAAEIRLHGVRVGHSVHVRLAAEPDAGPALTGSVLRKLTDLLF